MTQQAICLLAEKVIEPLLWPKEGGNDHFVIDLWEWPQGVAMYGLFRYWKATGNEKYLDFMKDWYQTQVQKGLPVRNVNTVAPMLALSCLQECGAVDGYLPLITEWAEWILTQMPRTPEGGLQHITTHDVNPGQIWDDTLFMTVLFLGKAGRMLGREDMVQEAVRQFLLHIKYLHDPSTGLWFHGWSFQGRHHFGKGLWARGNSWYTSASVEFIEIMGLEGAVRDILLSTLDQQVEALIRLQREDGMWHTLLDDPDSYVETSATAGFAFGLLKAVRTGHGDARWKEAARRAAEAVMCRVDEKGIVLEVSYGTAMGHDLDHYRNIAICPTAYGQGLTFLMLTELLQCD